MTTQEELQASMANIPQTAASPEEVLALEPHRLADAQEGPHPQISATTWVEWTKPSGDTFIAPLANAETYERKGFTRGADVEIEDIQAYLAEAAAQEAPAPTEGSSGG